MSCNLVYDLHIAFIKSICASLHCLCFIHQSKHLHVYTVAHSVVKNAIKIKSTCYYNLHVEYTESVYASYTPHNIQYMPFINYVNMLLMSLMSHIQSVCAVYFCYSLYRCTSNIT